MRLDKLTLNNFKYFYGNNEIDFNQKNLLLYGENGSGKSSIFWALYTILQSSIKDDANIAKYFDISKSANLINKFANDNEKGSLKLELIDNATGKESFEISETVFQTNKPNKTTIKEANQASDFINNRLLTRFYNFRNSEDIDLFPIFAKDIFQFINFGVSFQGNNNNANDWWQFISAGINPKPKMRDLVYIDFMNLVDIFNDELKKYITSIIQSANDYLQKKFNENYQISFAYENCTYNDFKPGPKKSRSWEIKNPKIKLNVKDLHAKLDEAKQNIPRPHTFLNEARLTAIGLSIRFAVLDEKLKKRDACKLLVIDDLLISLDMSNRDKVLNIILNKFNDYQIIFMTHDKMFYNLMKNRILQSPRKDKWIMKELYEDVKDEIPVPFLTDLECNLEIAKKHLSNFDYPACANYLRKECEKLLKEFLPTNLSVTINKDGTRAFVNLDAMIEQFINFYNDLFNDDTTFSKLKEYKSIILNPFSHDNIDIPIYKRELEELIELIEKLRMLEKEVIKDLSDEISSTLILKETCPAGIEWEYKIKLIERLSEYKSVNGERKKNNPMCCFIERKNIATNNIESFCKKLRLSKGYKNIRHKLGLVVLNEEDLIQTLHIKIIS